LINSSPSRFKSNSGYWSISPAHPGCPQLQAISVMSCSPAVSQAALQYSTSSFTGQLQPECLHLLSLSAIKGSFRFIFSILENERAQSKIFWSKNKINDFICDSKIQAEPSAYISAR
jgi:hypothetical protein